MADGLILSLKNGKIRGIRCTSEYSGKTFYSFLGVPYAKPPMGDLRFKPPVPLENWKGIMNSTKEKEDCIQYSLYLLTMIGSEDCLYLNVHIPEIPTKITQPKAVVVLIHGGSLLWGSGSRNVHGSPEYLMHQDIIYVTINYRLHILGFLNLNLPDCPGNVGLKDIVMSLKWIKENIGKFGGDPDNITLIGSSCGAIIIHLLLLSPMSRGLFHKVIMMGMYAFHPFIVYEKNSLEVAFTFARGIGFTGNDPIQLLNFLKNQPVHKLMEQLKEINSSAQEKHMKMNPSSPFAFTVEEINEGAFISKPLDEMMMAINPVPIIYGVCDIENMFTFFSNFPTYIKRNFSTLYRQNIYSWSHKLNDNTMKIIEKKLQIRYMDEFADENERLISHVMAQQDLIILDFYDTVANVIFTSSPSTPVYIYHFEYQGELNEVSVRCGPLLLYQVKGTLHSDDFSYWACRNKAPNEEDTKMVETFTKLFINFAKTGNPNLNCEEVHWKPSTPLNPSYLHINRKLKVTKGRLNNGKLTFWENIKKNYLRKY